MTVSVMVFTRDLRLADNPALAAAARAPAVVPLFVLDEAILRRASGHANRLGFLLDSLRDLDSGLRNAGGALVLRAGAWAETVLATARAAGAGRLGSGRFWHDRRPRAEYRMPWTREAPGAAHLLWDRIESAERLDVTCALR